MKLRSGKTLWPVVHDDGKSYTDFDKVISMLKSFTIQIILTTDITVHRIIGLETSYMLLNNHHFHKHRMYQVMLCVMFDKFSKAKEPPPNIVNLVRKLRSLKLSVRRWSILRASVKFLSLHSRAVVTANHPSRLDFSVTSLEA